MQKVNQCWWQRAAGMVRARMGLYGVLVLALGVLLWSRLLLVTRPPRVAIAEPMNMLVQPGDRTGVGMAHDVPLPDASTNPEATFEQARPK
jgi:hypothetical protein